MTTCIRTQKCVGDTSCQGIGATETCNKCTAEIECKLTALFVGRDSGGPSIVVVYELVPQSRMYGATQQRTWHSKWGCRDDAQPLVRHMSSDLYAFCVACLSSSCAAQGWTAKQPQAA